MIHLGVRITRFVVVVAVVNGAFAYACIALNVSAKFYSFMPMILNHPYFLVNTKFISLSRYSTDILLTSLI